MVFPEPVILIFPKFLTVLSEVDETFENIPADFSSSVVIVPLFVTLLFSAYIPADEAFLTVILPPASFVKLESANPKIPTDLESVIIILPVPSF